MEIVIAIAANIVVGLILLALFAWYRSPGNARLSGPDEALSIYRQHFPDASGTVTVAADGLAALISLRPAPGVGLLQLHGKRWSSRELTPEDLRTIAVEGDVINISLLDFGWPRCSVRIADPDSRADWVSRLNALAARSERSKVASHA